MTESSHLLKQLHKRGEKSPTAALAQVVVQQVLDRKLNVLLDARRIQGWVLTALKDWDDARLATTLAAEFARLTATYGALSGATSRHLPAAIPHALAEQLRKPLPLDPVLLTALLDQPVVRSLVRDVLQTTLVNFVKKASTPLSEHRLFSGVVDKAKGWTRGVGGGVLAAVSSGLEAEAERRIKDFVDDAVSAALQQAVAHLCDPRLRDAYGAMRVGVMESALALTPGAWMAQLRDADPVERGLALVFAFRTLAGTDEFHAWVVQQIERVVGPRLEHSLGSVLEELGLLSAARAVAVEVAQYELELLFSSDAFKTWLEETLGEGEEPKAKPARKKTKPSRS
ncbi:MAG: hypothetical protein AB2A00_09830 [Myxococcota bacterium]